MSWRALVWHLHDHGDEDPRPVAHGFACPHNAIRLRMWEADKVRRRKTGYCGLHIGRIALACAVNAQSRNGAKRRFFAAEQTESWMIDRFSAQLSSVERRGLKHLGRAASYAEAYRLHRLDEQCGLGEGVVFECPNRTTNSSLVKVGVEGSNPFARYRFSEGNQLLKRPP